MTSRPDSKPRLDSTYRHSDGKAELFDDLRRSTLFGVIDQRDPAYWHDQEDSAYRAIGRYVAEFSLLVATMRDDVSNGIAGTDAARNRLAGLALGALTAQQIADAFFAICRASTTLDADEIAIEKCLRVQIDEEIRRRNRIAHGDWLVTIPMPDQPDDQVAALVRVKPSNIREPFITEDLTVADIESFVFRVKSLEQVVAAFGAGCLGGHARVRTLLELDGREVIHNQE